jgi:phenylpropionate dioxygenase-like ring-hydroxylating dioxygenase large terminal subunit
MMSHAMSQLPGNRNAWYIACPASRLELGPLPIRVFDRDLVVFRDAALAPCALLDRCCHRGVQLSLGRVENGAIACRYHGWQYGGDGKCIRIPSLSRGARIPRGAEVASFSCVERDGYVWVWAGEKTADLQQLPSIPEFSRYRWRQGTVLLGCTAEKAIENNLDWVHPYFTHPWSHGQFFAARFRGFREQQFEMRLTSQGMVVFAPITGSADAPIPTQPNVRIELSLPNRVSVEFQQPFHFILIMHFVPTGDSSCRQEWLMSKSLPLGRKISLARRTPRVFAQDKRVLESAQVSYDIAGASFEQSVEADAPTLLVRRILTLGAEDRWADERDSLPFRRIVTARC